MKFTFVAFLIGKENHPSLHFFIVWHSHVVKDGEELNGSPYMLKDR